MTIYDSIKISRDHMRKIGHSLSVTYQTILGEIERKIDADKRSDDAAVETVLKTLHKGWSESYAIQPTETLKEEIEILAKYLPKMLTDQQLHDIAVTFKTMTLGDFMKYLKTNHANQYDGKKATEIFKSL